MTIAAPGWPQRGPTQDQNKGSEELKPQVSTGQVFTFGCELAVRGVIGVPPTG